MIINLSDKEADYDVYIGRGGKWGNPYSVEGYGRELAIKLYKKYLWEKIKKKEISLEELASLHNKTLACYCVPLKCHGSVLEKAAKWAHNELNL